VERNEIPQAANCVVGDVRLLAVLLLLLYARSYWVLDILVRHSNSNSLNVRSDAGLITISQTGYESMFSGSGTWTHIVDNASFGMIFWQFDWLWEADLRLVRTPIWFPVFAAAIFAGAPWIH